MDADVITNIVRELVKDIWITGDRRTDSTNLTNLGKMIDVTESLIETILDVNDDINQEGKESSFQRYSDKVTSFAENNIKVLQKYSKEHQK